MAAEEAGVAEGVAVARLVLQTIRVEVADIVLTVI